MSVQPTPGQPTPGQPLPGQSFPGAHAEHDEERRLALKRVKARRDVGSHAVTYVVVNAFLVIVWYVTTGPDSYFWPVWSLAGWGIGLVLNVWDVYGRRPITEDDIDRELRRGRQVH